MRLVSDLLEREDVMTTQRYTKVLENRMPQGMQKTHLFRCVMFPADTEVGRIRNETTNKTRERGRR